MHAQDPNIKTKFHSLLFFLWSTRKEEKETMWYSCKPSYTPYEKSLTHYQRHTQLFLLLARHPPFHHITFNVKYQLVWKSYIKSSLQFYIIRTHTNNQSNPLLVSPAIRVQTTNIFPSFVLVVREVRRRNIQ